MTKFELIQRLNTVTSENAALGSRVAQLHAQLIAERATRKGSMVPIPWAKPDGTWTERIAAAKAAAMRTGKCVRV